MENNSAERQELLAKFLETQEKLRKLEQENDLLKETNFRLSQELELKENAVDNLFSFIEGLKK